MTERIQEFLRNRRSEGQDTEPCLVVDLEVVRDNYQTFAKALPDSRVFYAVKANPAPEVLSLLAQMGSCFDTATVAEIEMALARHKDGHMTLWILCFDSTPMIPPAARPLAYYQISGRRDLERTIRDLIGKLET